MNIPVFGEQVVGRITFSPLVTLGLQKPKLPIREGRIVQKCWDEPDDTEKKRTNNPAGRVSKIPPKVRSRIRKEHAIGVRLRARAAKYSLGALSKKYKLSKKTLWYVCKVKR